MTEADAPRRATRRESGNENVDTGETHTIRGMNRTNLQVFDQYVRRNAGDSYCPKLRYWKRRKGEFLLGFPAEFTLSHDEAVELHAVLAQGLAVAAGGQPGEFLTLPLASTPDQGPNEIARAALPLLSGEGVLSALAGIPDARSLVVGIQTAARVSNCSRPFRS
jgi:hypothetical protein